MLNFLTHLVSSGGLLAIFLLMTAESAGVPISSEIVGPLGGALASGALGGAPFNLPEVVAAASLGNLCGSLIAYLLVRRYGEGLMLGPGRRIGLRPSHMRLAERFFDRFGLFAVFLGRLLPVIRTYISFPAGLSPRVRPLPFIIATLLGAIPWNAALAYAGFVLGSRWKDVEHTLGGLTIPFGVVLVALLVLAYIVGRRMGLEERILEAETGGNRTPEAP